MSLPLYSSYPPLKSLEQELKLVILKFFKTKGPVMFFPIKQRIQTN